MPFPKNSGLPHHHRGFTLIELMVAVVIVAILAGIAYPSYLESVRKAKRAQGRTALMQLMQLQEGYYSRQNSYVAFSSSSENKDQFKWFSGDNPESSSYEIKAEACTGESIVNCVQLSAMPGTEKVDSGFKDPICGTLKLSSTGIQSPETAECWK
jgi:type IV pilus assembly protein PilE